MDTIKGALGMNKEESATTEHASHSHDPTTSTTSTTGATGGETAPAHDATTTGDTTAGTTATTGTSDTTAATGTTGMSDTGTTAATGTSDAAATTATAATTQGENASSADVSSQPTPAGHGGDDVQSAQAEKAVKRVESGEAGGASGKESGGRDPALEGDDSPENKLTGTGAPGSHSAVFGLTPDGKKNTDTSHGSAPPKPAEGGDAMGGGQESSEGDTGSRAPTGNPELKEQMQSAGADDGKTSEVPSAGGSELKPGESQSAGSTGNI